MPATRRRPRASTAVLQRADPVPQGHRVTACRAHMGMPRLILAVLLSCLTPALGMIIQNMLAPNRSAIAHASSGGGTHIYIQGTDIGSAFAPPTVTIGGSLCQVQAFTSTNNRMHCIVQTDGLPAPSPVYNPDGEFVSRNLFLYKGSEGPAACWHTGGPNHGCVVQFDVGGSPRIKQVLTPELEPLGFVMLDGEGIGAGLTGDPTMSATIYRSANEVLGACGEKDCQPANLGSETIGCETREGGKRGDSVHDSNANAITFADEHTFGCQLDELPSGLRGGFFNISLNTISPEHRGDAYKGFSAGTKVDLITASTFDLELIPRITAVAPAQGSKAGGSRLTISGVGFGVDTALLAVTVGSATCDVVGLTSSGITCNLRAIDATASTANVLPGERGVRWQYSSAQRLLLPAFEIPVWTEVTPASGGATALQSWFEAPANGTVRFMLKMDAVSSLRWSGDATTSASQELASVSVAEQPVLLEIWNGDLADRPDVFSHFFWCDQWGDAETIGPSQFDKLGLCPILPHYPSPDTSQRVSTVQGQMSGLAGEGARFGGVPNHLVHWSGKFSGAASGEATFRVTTTGHARLYVNGKQVVYRWDDRCKSGVQCSSTATIGHVDLRANSIYKFDLWLRR